MSWLRLDDGFTKHPKFEGWTTSQKWAWLEVMEYCARYQTEGRVPDDLSILPRSTTKTLLDRAENAGWCARQTDGSLWINDWEKYNPKDPTKAVRQAKWRAKRDGLVDDGVDADVDGKNPSTEPSTRARASAPVPVPSPSSYSSSVVNGADDESIKKELIQLARSDQQGLDWLKAYHDNPERIRGLLVTARSGATSNVGGYLAALIANGSEPGSDTKPVDQRILTALLRWVRSPAYDPETMTEDTVLDEIRLRETKLHGHLAVEQRLQVLDAATAKREGKETAA